MAGKRGIIGTKNLIPFDELSEEEHRAIASEGGRRSVIARREKKQVKELLRTLFDAEAPLHMVEEVKKKFPHVQIKTLEELINFSMMKQAYSGNVGAYNALYDRMEGKPKQEIDQNLSGGIELKNVKSLLGESIQEEE